MQRQLMHATATTHVFRCTTVSTVVRGVARVHVQGNFAILISADNFMDRFHGRKRYKNCEILLPYTDITVDVPQH